MEKFTVPFNASDKVLEVGGGDNPLFPGYWVNLDCRAIPGVDIVADLNEAWPVDSEAYDGVFGQFIIEHISWRNLRRFIGEIHRVLRPNGMAVMITSNLLEQAKLLVETEEWNDKLIGMIFGDNDYPENTHRSSMSPQYALKLFREAGFHSVTIYEHPVAKQIWGGHSTDMIIEAKKSGIIIMRSLS